ncbi:MAG: hypothetical protein MUP31_04210 [Xanthomonadales bacterium]|nr:hypothetical protein [Xanthomonadales bacterium]
MKKQNKSSFPAILALSSCLAFAIPVQAAEVDFSCMSYKVWGKSHISDQYTSYDVVIQNSCPGSVYWAMCIERLDPDSHKVVETHNPSGYVDAEKKARVNLNLHKKSGNSLFRNRFQEFYVDIAYAIDTLPVPKCYAAQCEAKKGAIRAEIRANETAWESAEKALAARIAAECPDTGWDTASFSECGSKVREANASEMEEYPLKDQELRDQMAAIDPEICEVYSGDLVIK